MIGYIILAILVVFITILVIRTALNKPKETEKVEIRKTRDDIDKDLIAEHLSQAVQFPTITLINDTIMEEPFYEYHNFLEKTYPNIFKIAEVKKINKLSLLIKIEGTDKDLLPIAFLAHQDVVPAPKDGWDVEPFSGVIKDNYVYGRGTLDMKGQMIANLEALEYLLIKGVVPKRGIYFCFGHDEENTGSLGAKNISEYLEKEGVRFEYVFDEGGIILDGKVLGVKGFIALIGTAEKGYMDVELKAKVDGGHASTPTKNTAVAQLSKAIYKLNKSPIKPSFNASTIELFEKLSPYMKTPFKFLFTNRKILSPLILKILTIASPLTNALLRTTFAPTQINGSLAPNVLPKEATGIINVRINIGETYNDVLEHIKKVVGKNIEVNLVSEPFNPTVCSVTNCKAYEILTKTIKETYENFIPAPYPFIAATDAKHYYNLSKNVYRFTPFKMSNSDRTRIHALNERIGIDNLKCGVEFFINLLENSIK